MCERRRSGARERHKRVGVNISVDIDTDRRFIDLRISLVFVPHARTKPVKELICTLARDFVAFHDVHAISK